MSEFAEEVAGRFGVLPNFFCSAPAAPGLIEGLWGFAKSAYLNNPLPSLFKERLFVHLSRFCEVRYCVVRHVGFLIGEGRPAGDAEAPVETVAQALALLKRPVPEGEALDRVYDRLLARDPAAALPKPETPAEGDLFDALTTIFLTPSRSARARAAVRHAVGDREFELLTAFLAFVRTAHYWTETHPDLACEPDMRVRMEAHPELAGLLLDAREAEAASVAAVRARLAATETALRQREGWLAAEKGAFQAAMNGEPLAASLGILLKEAEAQAGDDRRCAYYMLSADGGTLSHVAGMPDAYARQVDGFVVAPDSLACGLAVARGEPVITPDVADEPRWREWLWLAQNYDYRGCWSFPVETAAGERVGSLAMYFRDRREPEASDLELAATLTHAASIIISRHRENEDRARAEAALRESEERLRSLVQGIPQLVWRSGRKGGWTWASPQWTAYTGQPGPESHGQGWLAAVHPADRATVLAAWGQAEASGALRADHRLWHAAENRHRWVESKALPVRDDRGRIVEWLGTTTDVEELRRAHERELFIAELQHRGRNLLTVVSGIAEQMLATGGSLEEFGAQFDQRLAAIGRAQGLLSREVAARVTVGELVRLELAAHGADGGGDRAGLEGPEVTLPTEAVQMLALALHELLTNALKHGALATPGGGLTIAWGERRDTEGRRLRLDWRESGVVLPADAATRRRGFGLDLIEHSLSYELDAKTELAFTVDGLRCTIDLPLGDAPAEEAASSHRAVAAVAEATAPASACPAR